MPRKFFLTIDPATFEAHSLDALSVGPLITWPGLPIVALSAEKAAEAAIATTPGVLFVHKPQIGMYGNILSSLQKLLQLPEDKRGQVQTINISISGGPGPFLELEPMNVATRILADAGYSIIVAVGNEGPGEDTLNPWAVAPWVIGVTAADRTATSIWNKSSVGRADDPRYRPCVAAPGQDIPVLIPQDAAEFKKRHGTAVASVALGFPLDHAEAVESGTSLAAPVVARLCIVLQFFLNGLYSVHAKLDEVRKTGNIDLADAILFSKMEPFPAFLTAFRNAGLQASYNFLPANKKAMLEAAARPMPGYAPHQAGAGFIDDEVLIAFLKRFSARDFLRFLTWAPEGTQLPALNFDGPIVSEQFVDSMIEELRQEMSLLDMPVLDYPEAVRN